MSIWDEIIQIPIQSMKLSFAPDKIETLLYSLAIMATSGGHFSRPSGMGGYVVELHIQDDTFFNGNNWEGMTIFGRNDTNPEGMTIIRKE